METFKNHASKRMTEFRFIIPTLVHYLEQIFLIPNNEYNYDEASGRIKSSNRFIDNYKTLNEKDWENLIKLCHRKEKAYLNQFKKILVSKPKEYFEETLNVRCEAYYPIIIEDKDFETYNLYTAISDFSKKQQEIFENSGIKIYVRLKVMSENSLIKHINRKSHKYLKVIALNFIECWLMFLNEEIRKQHYEKEPSHYASLEQTLEQIAFLNNQKIRIL